MQSTVARACALRGLLANDGLQRLVARIDSLPSPPSLYAEIMDELASEKCSFQKVGEIISKDLAMTAKILQLVNSAFFGLRRRIVKPSEAIGLLGIDVIRALALSVHVFSEYDIKNLPGFSIEAVWHHSMNVAVAAKQIAQAQTQERSIADDAFMAGVLHDVGKLIFAQNMTDQYIGILERSREGAMTNHIHVEVEDWSDGKKKFKDPTPMFMPADQR